MVGILSIGISVKLVILSNITAASKADKKVFSKPLLVSTILHGFSLTGFPRCLLTATLPKRVPATHSEIRQLISAINHMEQRMSSMKRELADETDARVAKKLKEADKQPALKKKGHQKQFQFNEDVRERLTEASAAIHQTPAAVERAKTAIQEGMDLLNKRRKLIKIADRSDHAQLKIRISLNSSYRQFTPSS